MYEDKIITDPDNEDVEVEDNSTTIINAPFDPNQIKVTTQPLTLGDLIDRLEHNEIMINTEYQRLPNLWNDTKKSRLIESILLRLPIPTFYFDGQDDNKWRVIDGLQRISTLKSFVIDKGKDKLVLENLEFLKQYNAQTFDSLPRDLQRRIKTFPITVYILDKGTPDEVKYNIFSRINQGGLVLKPQEIRNALHQGIGSDLIKELVDRENPFGCSFLIATEEKISSQRMEDRDFAARFVSFYLIPYSIYEPDLDSFMNKGMALIKTLSEKERLKLKNDFKKAMETAFGIFGNDSFRKRFDEESSRKPINKALFEVLSVNFAKLSESECATLIEKKIIFKQKLIALFNNSDGKFLRAITHGTAKKDVVNQRFHAIELIIKETLQT